MRRRNREWFCVLGYRTETLESDEYVQGAFYATITAKTRSKVFELALGRVQEGFKDAVVVPTFWSCERDVD